jgi:hypothetical protein
MTTLKTIRNIAMVFMICVLVFISIRYAAQNYKENLVTLTELSPPYVHGGDGKALSSVRVGQEYFVRITTKRLIACDIVVLFYFKQTMIEGDIPRVIVWYPYPVYTSRVEAGTSMVDRFIVIPIYMKPGDYVLIRQSQYNCGGEAVKQNVSIPIRIAK